MVERDFPDGRMQKLMGKPWSSWNLPEQPTELDLRKLRDAYLPPDQYRVHHQSTPLPPRYMPLFGTHPDSDYVAYTKCTACGWLLKVQHANKHFLRDSRGAIVCKDSDLAIFGSKVLGKACHPVGELKDTYSRKITLRLVPAAQKSSHALRGTSSINEMVSKSRSGSGSHTTNKTDYFSNASSSQYRSRSHTQMHVPSSAYMQKGRSGSGTTSSSSTHGSSSMHSSSSVSKGKSGKSHSSSSTSSWSSLRSPPPSKSSSSHKPPQSTPGSYTLSIPSEDMGQNESVEDLLMSNTTHTLGSSKHTVHIIATSNSANKSKLADPDFDRIKYYSEQSPEKRIKLDPHCRTNDHHHKTSPDITDLYKIKKSSHSNSSLTFNGAASSHISSSESSKKSKTSSLSKNDSGSSNKHHLRSTAPTTNVTLSKPIVSVSNISSSGQSRSHSLGTIGSSSTTEKEKEKDKEKTSSQKKKKRKRDKDEPRKIIPLKDRDFNPDKHCGVCTQGANVPCKRSLTCKTHSVALRRAVVGRSQSFDALLAAHKLAKSEEKESLKPKEVVEEVNQVPPPTKKKKKPSGSISTVGSSPNDPKPLTGVLEPTSYDRSGSPDIEVIEVKTKPKPMIPTVDYVYPKKHKTCPLVYPYTPDIQAKFETVWNNPATMDRGLHVTPEEKHKFVFLLKHYKNPYFVNSEVSQPLAKNVREKRNVFSNWNPSEKPVDGSQHTISWTQDRRQIADVEDDVQFLGVNKKN